MEQSKPKEKKIRVFITVQPYNIKFGAMFNPHQDIIAINKFVFEQFEKIKIKFDIGRIESMETLAILLPGNHIGDFLKEDSEVVVYSQEYGLNLKMLPGDGIDQRLPLHHKVSLLYNGEQKKMLGKKTIRNKSSNKEANHNIKKEKGKQHNTKGKETGESKKDEKVNENQVNRQKSIEKEKEKENEKEVKKDKEKEGKKDKNKEKGKEKDKKKTTQPKSTKDTDKSSTKLKKYIGSSDNDSN